MSSVVTAGDRDLEKEPAQLIASIWMHWHLLGADQAGIAETLSGHQWSGGDPFAELVLDAQRPNVCRRALAEVVGQ